MRHLWICLTVIAMSVAGQGRVPDSLATGPFRTTLVDGAHVVQARPLMGAHPRYRELRCATVLPGRPADVMDMLARTAFAPRWMARCAEATDVGPRSAEEWTVHYVYDLPWPLRDRDGVLRYNVVREWAGAIHVEFESVPNAVPEITDMDRDRGVRGTWELTPQGTDMTVVVYYVSSQEDIGLPLWMTDPIVLPILTGSMEALANLLRESARLR